MKIENLTLKLASAYHPYEAEGFVEATQVFYEPFIDGNAESFIIAIRKMLHNMDRAIQYGVFSRMTGPIGNTILTIDGAESLLGREMSENDVHLFNLYIKEWMKVGYQNGMASLTTEIALRVKV